jgi:hypothetical protein
MDKLRQLWQKVFPYIKQLFKVNTPVEITTEDAQLDMADLTPTNYEKVITEVQGQTAVIFITLDLQDIAPIDSHTDLLELVVSLNEPTADGLATDGETRQIEAIRDQFMAIPNSLFVGSVTAGSMYNAYIYLPTGTVVSDTFKTLNIPQQYSFDVRPDPSWQYYNELLPTLDEAERIINGRQINELMQKGINLALPQNIVHTVSGNTKGIKDLQKEFANSEYTLATQTTEPGKAVLLMSKNELLDLNSITAETIDLSQIAASYGAIYVGWDIVSSTTQAR